jgi:RNA polymerase sigma-70 factor (ECF subfamily)
MEQRERVKRFITLTRPYHERLMRVAMTLCHDQDMAADLTQEALARAFAAFHRFRPDAPVFPWLARILRNLYLDHRRSARSRHELAEHQLAGDGPGPLELAKTTSPTPLAAVEQAQLVSWVQQELAALPAAQRLVLVLCDVEELTYKEVAEVVDAPVGTVRSRLARARQALRSRLNKRLAAAGSSEREDPVDGTH